MACLKKALLVFLALCLAVPVSLLAENNYAIDTPTTDILDYGMYNLNFRLFSNGGILTRLDFGVFKIVNLGFGWETSDVIGTQDVSVAPPALSIKIKPYDGGIVLPALVLGYDGQGNFYNKSTNEYTEREKGIYVALGRETVIPGLKLTAGANMWDFQTNTVYGFVNATMNLEDKFMIIGECDNIHSGNDDRINAGFRIPITEALSIDLAGRDIGAPGRTAERIIRLNYIGKF
jgi:hypothetical protein